MVCMIRCDSVATRISVRNAFVMAIRLSDKRIKPSATAEVAGFFFEFSVCLTRRYFNRRNESNRVPSCRDRLKIVIYFKTRRINALDRSLADPDLITDRIRTSVSNELMQSDNETPTQLDTFRMTSAAAVRRFCKKKLKRNCLVIRERMLVWTHGCIIQSDNVIKAYIHGICQNAC